MAIICLIYAIHFHARFEASKEDSDRDCYLGLASWFVTALFCVSWILFLEPNQKLNIFLVVSIFVTQGVPCLGGVYFFIKIIHRNALKEPIEEHVEEDISVATKIAELCGLINLPNDLVMECSSRVYQSSYSAHTIADAVNVFLRYLPNRELMTEVEGDNNYTGNSFRSTIIPALEIILDGKDEDLKQKLRTAQAILGRDQYRRLLDMRYRVEIPERLRTEHHHIVAGAGHGKTQCIQQMITNDLTSGAGMVVIDSQGDMINTIAPRIDPSRIILVDPETCPPALNLFAGQTSEKQIATTIELYEYIFSALDAQMTSKQQTAYRFVTRLLLIIPDANIHTMREILEPGTKHQEYIQHLDATAQSFFVNEFNSRQFAETRSQILRRIYTVLESSTLSKMLGATKATLDIGAEVNKGKIILVSTAKSFLKQTGASLFGRIFIAQVMQAVMDRKDNRRRTYLYIDEFADYAEDSFVLFNLFEQARKYNLGLVVAHQYLGQLPPKLQQSISANTAIKFAGGVSAEDASKLASQMGVDKSEISAMKKGNFMAYFRGLGTIPYPVEFGTMENLPERQSLEHLQKVMRERYGVKQQRPNLQRVADQKGEYVTKEDLIKGFSVDEQGDWEQP